MSVLTLADPLAYAGKHFAERVAVIDGEVQLRYRELYERSHRLGASLRASGLPRGARVALLAANGHRYLEAFFGIPAHGLVLVPLNTRLAMPELQSILRDSGARILLTDRDPGVLAGAVERVVSLPGGYEALQGAAAATTVPAAGALAAEEDAVAVLFYTGGTTGQPKGVMLTHRNLVANAFHKTIACSLTAQDVFLAAAAMFHVAGIAPLASLVWLGATSVTLPAFDPEGCLDLIERHAVTVAMPVPTMLAALTAAQRARPRNVDSLRLLGHAGSPIAREVIEAAHAVFPKAELAQFYGATETSSIVTCLRNEQAAIGTPLLGSCGRAVQGVEIKVARSDGSDCEPGEVGEVLVRGPNVTLGYWRNPQATAAALAGGFYHTGDLGVLRGDGHLFVVDRLKDMIVTGAENVYSIEVEDVLHRHPAVLEAAVFGIPNERWGEAVYAVVVVSAGDVSRGEALARELQAHCREAIAGYKVPKQIELRLEPLPKSGPGKILKRALRQAFARRSEP